MLGGLVDGYLVVGLVSGVVRRWAGVVIAILPLMIIPDRRPMIRLHACIRQISHLGRDAALGSSGDLRLDVTSTIVIVDCSH